MYVWRMPYQVIRNDDVIFKRHECEWILPLAVAEHLKYNSRSVPAIRYEVKWLSSIRGNYVHIIQHMRSDYYYNRRVFAAYGERDAHSIHMDGTGSYHSCTYLCSDWSD